VLANGAVVLAWIDIKGIARTYEAGGLPEGKRSRRIRPIRNAALRNNYVATFSAQSYNYVPTSGGFMQTPIRRMGNSAAILLPKPVLAHLHVSAGDVLELDLQDGRVVLSRAHRHPREGWAEAAQALAGADEGALEWPEFENVGDHSWSW
jgi:antitoxin MazE